MIALTAFKGKTVGVFGLGKAGTAAVRAMLAGGATVFAWDDTEKSRGALVDERATSKHGHLGLDPIQNWPWAELSAIVLSPGIPFTHPKPHEVVLKAQEHNVPVVGEVDLLYQAQPFARYIGITGTNGKSTTTALIAHILHDAGLLVEVGGNLGTPALALKPMADEKNWYVLEMSSYQLDLCNEVKFDAAVLLNITPDHLDRHGGMQGYIKAKRRIFDRQTAKDIALVGLDDGDSRDVFIDLVRHRQQLTQPFTVTQHNEKGVVVDEDGILHDFTGGKEIKQNLANIKRMKGRHNWQNVAAAYSVARFAGVEPNKIMEAVHSFPGLPHRMEIVGERSGLTFINDSKATNADATSHALAPFDRIYWILGGKAKEGGIDTLPAYFHKIAHAFLIGEAAVSFAATLDKYGVSYTQCGDLQTATQKASNRAFEDMQKGSVILLSPACASFDQWKSFEHRGDAFRNYVKVILGSK